MSKPHIVFIITDQQRFDTIAALGHDFVDTPNLDRLVSEGVTFTNCHTSAPSCAPSRASLFTGYYPHTTGILKNADVWKHSWIECLAEQGGYRTINIGKMHTYPYHTPLGFEERYVVENKDRYLDRLKAAIVRAGWDLNEFTEGIRMRQAAMRDGERTEDSEESEDDRIWREAMATDPDEWSEELKAQLLELAPGRAIEDIAGWIRQRQEAMREGEATNVAGDGE